MKSDLKEFVQKFVEVRAKESFPHLYIVDKVTGPYRRIQQAIDAAEPNSLIKVSQGFYEENLVITKPLRIQPKNLRQQNEKMGVVLLASLGTAITVKLSDFDQQCQITEIKISHSGNSDSHLKNELMEHEHILNIFQSRQSIEQLQNEYVNRTQSNKVDCIILLIEKGKVRLNGCILSLSYLVKSCKSTIPAIWIEREGYLQVMNSQIRGHGSKPTIGIVCRLGVLIMQNSAVNSHSEGGILIWGVQQNPSKIIKNIFQNNSIGVHVVGEQFKLRVINNEFKYNKTGIKVGLACETQINRNLITENGEGIEVHSAFPSISLNKIQKNAQNGIVLHTYKKFICKAQIKKNIAIVGNGKNGILIQGQNNKSIISNNFLIGFNEQAGIKIVKQANPLICYNKIHKNHRQGILASQKTKVSIIQNDISDNIECNVAIGGVDSHHSLIAQNKLTGSLGAGLNLIHAGRCTVSRNDIVHNHNGVMIFRGTPQIRRTYIAENKNNGLVCEQNAQPRLVQNFITRNHAVGLLLRHNSGGSNSDIHSNIVVGNQINLCLQQKNKGMLTALPTANTIQGQIYYPQQIKCNLI